MRVMKVRDLIRRMTELGAEPLRNEGSHQMWRLPNGTHVPIVVKHQNDEVTANVLASVRRKFRECGVMDL